MNKFYFDAEEEKHYPDFDAPKKEMHDEQYLADLFHEQINTFYSIPREQRLRSEIYFSPSGVDKCMRELYYENTNAEKDTIPLIPWRERMSRNGTGCHDITQDDYFKMEEKLKKAGHSVHFKFLDAEFDGEKSYTVNGHTVKLRGRSDGKLGLLDENGDVSRIIGFEKKTKDKRKNLNKILKEGSPQDTHKKQAVAYALIWGITDWIFEYESLSKPEWSDINPDKEDIAHYFVSVSKEEAKELLLRLASVVEAIKEEKLPEPDLSKCGFCPFKNQCHKDGGYSFEEKKSSKK